MNNFIYVFTKDDRDKLVSLGCELLKNDENNNIYIFTNDFNTMDFDEGGCLKGVSFVTCDTLTF